MTQPAPSAAPLFYNPDWVDDGRLVQGFVARLDLYAFLRGELARTPRHGTAQHMLLVGPRGAGKTTMLKRLAVAIRQDADLSDHLIALSFQEELYQLKNLADFWWAACDALCDELERRGRQAEADALGDAIDGTRPMGPRTDPQDAAGLRLLLETCARLERRPVLLVDNIDMVMQRIDTRGRKREDPLSPAYWALREALSTAESPVVIGGAVRLDGPFAGYDKAFYDFFAVRRLSSLSLEEVEAILARLAHAHGTPDWEARLRARRGRIQALHEMTGGNPRALGLLFDLLRQGTTGRAVEDFERLMDLTTPYYKAMMEALSEQAQVIVHAMAQLRRWVPAADIARQAGLETRTVSAQLEILANDGVVEKKPGKKTLYIIAEQLFRIWLQMRSSRRLRQRVAYLTEFLEALYDREELDGLLAPGGALSERLRADALRDFALAEWQGEGSAIARALKARAARALLGGADEAPPCGPGDFDADTQALSHCRAALDGHRKNLGGLDPDQILGSLTQSREERCASADRLCNPATAAAERDRLRPILTAERAELERIGLTGAEIGRLYELRAGGSWRLPSLTVEEVEAEVRLDPGRAELYRHLAWKLLGAERIAVSSDAEARGWMEFGRDRLAGTTSDKWAKVAFAFRDGGFLEAATEAVEEALRRGDSCRAWCERGILLTEHLKRFNEAETAFRKAIVLDPSDGISWFDRGRLLTDQLDRFHEAEAAFRKATRIHPSIATFWFFLGEVLADHHGRIDEAEAAFRKAVALDPSRGFVWRDLGKLLDRPGRSDEAEAAFRRAITLDSSDAWSWTQLGVLWAEEHSDFSGAEIAFRKAIILNPSMGRAWAGLGLVMFKIDHLNHYNEILGALQRALILNPDVLPIRDFRDVLRSPQLTTPVNDAIAAENWGIVREHLQRWLDDPELGAELWSSVALAQGVAGRAVRLGHGERLLGILRELGIDKRALPLVLALEAAVAGSPDGLATVEPEARAAAELLYRRIMEPPAPVTSPPPAR